MQQKHIPVLLEEVLSLFDPKPSQTFLDGTVGSGGHAKAILERTSPKGLLIGFDLDKEAIRRANKQLNRFGSERFHIINSNFKEVKKKLDEFSCINSFDGILLDLGVSSPELGFGDRGFSFQTAGHLDMRFGQAGRSANDILKQSSKKELEKILKEYGQERFAAKIAEEIVKARQRGRLNTTLDLAGICQKVYSRKKINLKINPATRTFQAIRIAVNDELNNLKQALPEMVDLLKKGGKIAVISFHSLEDRIVKQFFVRESKDCICPPEFPKCTCQHKKQLKILTKKPIAPTREEISKNRRARSAKLRVAEKI